MDAGTSRVTLSVSNSTIGSSTSTNSPCFLIHFETVASTTDSPKIGTRTSIFLSFRLDIILLDMLFFETNLSSFFSRFKYKRTSPLVILPCKPVPCILETSNFFSAIILAAEGIAKSFISSLSDIYRPILQHAYLSFYFLLLKLD